MVSTMSRYSGIWPVASRSAKRPSAFVGLLQVVGLITDGRAPGELQAILRNMRNNIEEARITLTEALNTLDALIDPTSTTPLNLSLLKIQSLVLSARTRLQNHVDQQNDSPLPYVEKSEPMFRTDMEF